MVSIREQINDLPPKQRETLEQLIAFTQEHGYPPSIQQLCDLVGVTSTSTIHYHITALKKKGFIHWNPAEKRAISIHEDLLEVKGELPMLGSIAAGQPLMVTPESDLGNVERINLGEDLCPSGCYALKVRGESMIEDHIMDDDIVIINPKSRIRDGDVVVALVEGHATTLKRIFREVGRIRLQPANSEMEPIYATDVQVQGKVEAVIRKF